jgi:hypothetical protein
MEIRVCSQVGRIRFDALLVLPEGVAVESGGVDAHELGGTLLVTGAIPGLAKRTASIELASRA